jgi:hypothetical protein
MLEDNVGTPYLLRVKIKLLETAAGYWDGVGPKIEGSLYTGTTVISLINKVIRVVINFCGG